MSRYIDADALIEQIHIDSKGNEGQYGDEWEFMATIEAAPSIDIVRCNECRYRIAERVVSDNNANWIIYDVGECVRQSGTVNDDDFCSYGERKDL